MKIRTLIIPFVLSAAAGCATTSPRTVTTQTVDQDNCLITLADEDRRTVENEDGEKTEQTVERRVRQSFDKACLENQRKAIDANLTAELARAQANHDTVVNAALVRANADIVVTGLISPGTKPELREEILKTVLDKLSSEDHQTRQTWQAAVHASGQTEAGLRLEHSAAQKAAAAAPVTAVRNQDDCIIITRGNKKLYDCGPLLEVK